MTLRMLEAAIGRYTPQLHYLFKSNNIHISTFVQVYLHSLFAYPSISRRFCHLVWDHYILELHTAKRFEFLFRLTITILRTFEKTLIKLPPVEAVTFLKSGFQANSKLRHNSKLLRSAWKLSIDENCILFELPRVSHLRQSINQYEYMKKKYRKLTLDSQQVLPVNSQSTQSINFSLKRYHKSKINESELGKHLARLKAGRQKYSSKHPKLFKSEQRKDSRASSVQSKCEVKNNSLETRKPAKPERRKGSLTPTPTREATPVIEKPRPLKKSLTPPITSDGIPGVDKSKPRKGSLTPKPTVEKPRTEPSPDIMS